MSLVNVVVSSPGPSSSVSGLHPRRHGLSDRSFPVAGSESPSARRGCGDFSGSIPSVDRTKYGNFVRDDDTPLP